MGRGGLPQARIDTARLALNPSEFLQLWSTPQIIQSVATEPSGVNPNSNSRFIVGGCYRFRAVTVTPESFAAKLTSANSAIVAHPGAADASPAAAGSTTAAAHSGSIDCVCRP
jgi:hypothetical protein